MKIKYYDLLALKGIHTEINIAMLKVIMMSLSGYSSVDFYAEPGHSEICKNKWKDTSVRFHKLRLIPPIFFGSGGRMAVRDAISCLYVLKAFFTTNRYDFLMFSLAYPFAQNLIYLLSKLLNRENVYVCLHGEMEVLIDDRPFRSKKYQNLTKIVLKKKSNIHYIVLGESIFANLKHLFYNSENVIVIEHPYDFDQEKSPVTQIFKPLIIGQIGMGEISKGTHLLFELAKMLEKEIKDGQLQIKLIGRLNPQLLQYDNGLLSYYKEFLNTDDFNREIKKLHVTLQLVSDNQRKVTASGSFLDSLKYYKPYLSLSNDYIIHFNSIEPASGFIFKSINDMAEHIKHMLVLHEEELKSQYENSILSVMRLQKIFSLKTISEEFQKQITK